MMSKSLLLLECFIARGRPEKAIGRPEKARGRSEEGQKKARGRPEEEARGGYTSKPPRTAHRLLEVGLSHSCQHPNNAPLNRGLTKNK